MTTSIIYVTVGDRKEADLIASKIVEERLASSVNIVDSVRSYYWWSSAVQQKEEFVLIAKTRTTVVDAAIERIRDIHSYECPCIVSWPIEKRNRDYPEWIGRETEGTAIRWHYETHLHIRLFVPAQWSTECGRKIKIGKM